MAGGLRSEIRWADLKPTRGNEQVGLRPALMPSHDVFNARSGTMIAVALTSQAQRAGFPLTLAIERIGKRSGHASPEELAQVIEGSNEVLGA